MSFANIGMPGGPSASSGNGIDNVDVGGVENDKMDEPLLQSTSADIDTCARPPDSVVSGAVRAAAAVLGGKNKTSTTTGSSGGSSTSRAPPADAFGGTSARASSAKYHPPQPVLQLSNNDDEEQQIEFAASSNENSHHHQSDLMQYTTQHSDLDSALLTERNTEISYVHKSMSQISEIQRDLATLVDGQQEDIDAVEDHAEQTAHYAERGRRELEKAYHIWQQMSAKRRLVVKVLGAIVLLWVVAHHIHHARKEANGGGCGGGRGEEDGHDGGAWRR